MSDNPTAGYFGSADWLPWKAPREWALWFGLTIVTTIIVHNITRATMPKIGMPES